MNSLVAETSSDSSLSSLRVFLCSARLCSVCDLKPCKGVHSSLSPYEIETEYRSLTKQPVGAIFAKFVIWKRVACKEMQKSGYTEE